MDLEWFKSVLGVIAQHGPWAILAFWLAYMHIKRGEAQTDALVKTAEAITALKSHVEMLVRDREDKA